MSVFIDSITFFWACCVLFAYSNWLVNKRSVVSVIGFLATVTYLLAQSGWTVAFLLGDVWGRDLSNYIWFIFNTLIFALLTVIWMKDK